MRQVLDPNSAIEALKTPIGWSNIDDSLLWPIEKNGNYSTKSGYVSLMDDAKNSSSRPSTSFSHSAASWKGIWEALVPKRVKHFVWRVNHNAIASKLSLFTEKISRDSLCPISKTCEESIEHLFLLCRWTTLLWYGLQICPVPTPFNTTSVSIWLENMILDDNNIVSSRDLPLATAFIALW